MSYISFGFYTIVMLTRLYLLPFHGVHSSGLPFWLEKLGKLDNGIFIEKKAVKAGIVYNFQ